MALVPGTRGVFEVRVDGKLVFSRKRARRFPESKELKQLVRDRVVPGKALEHSDRDAEVTEAEAFRQVSTGYHVVNERLPYAVEGLMVWNGW